MKLYLMICFFILFLLGCSEEPANMDPITSTTSTASTKDPTTFGVGSTCEEVKAILGAPNSFIPEDSNSYEEWHYVDPETRLFQSWIQFDDGQVRAWDNVDRIYLR